MFVQGYVCTLPIFAPLLVSHFSIRISVQSTWISPSRSTFLYRISCLTNVYVFLYIYIEMHRSARSRVSHWLLCRFFFFFLHASRLFTCLQTSKELAVLVYTQRSAWFPFLNFTPRPFLAAPPARFERVTVVSRAKASPTRAGTHTRTCVQRGTSMIVCATTLPSFPRAGFTNGAKHFCAWEREDSACFH